MDAVGPAHSVPRSTKVGIVTIAVGLAADLAEHAVISHAHDAIVAGFPLGEHAAHLVVLVGMILVLAGIVADGIRSTGRADRPEAGRAGRPEGSSRDAVR
ncbi:MAG TPA: hypothetical protein VF802_01355 [Candidatus Limnocylindrales bacterium]